jgi:hypothetical protein
MPLTMPLSDATHQIREQLDLVLHICRRVFPVATRRQELTTAAVAAPPATPHSDERAVGKD